MVDVADKFIMVDIPMDELSDEACIAVLKDRGYAVLSPRAAQLLSQIEQPLKDLFYLMDGGVL